LKFFPRCPIAAHKGRFAEKILIDRPLAKQKEGSDEADISIINGLRLNVRADKTQSDSQNKIRNASELIARGGLNCAQENSTN
jgi:hypothetical protein